jgi:hypothetical protein
MTTKSVHVMWRSDHAFTCTVNARQARVTPRMHCKDNIPFRQATVSAPRIAQLVKVFDWWSEGWGIKSEHVSSTCVANSFLTHVHFTDKRALHWQKLVILYYTQGQNPFPVGQTMSRNKNMCITPPPTHTHTPTHPHPHPPPSSCLVSGTLHSCTLLVMHPITVRVLAWLVCHWTYHIGICLQLYIYNLLRIKRLMHANLSEFPNVWHDICKYSK